MTDMSVNPTQEHRQRGNGRVEYSIYFALLFLIGLPFATGGWLWQLATTGRPGPGVLRRAWVKAGELTPVIFSA